MGVWIEISVEVANMMALSVTPFMGVWIEIIYFKLFTTGFTSHPLWVCGLKSNRPILRFERFCHTLYGCVD